MLIIFDLDDTLIDTSNSITPFLLKGALIAVLENGFKVKNFDDTLSILLALDQKSPSAKETIKQFFKDEAYQKIALDVVYKSFSENIEIFSLKNAAAVLQELAQNHMLAIVSKGIPQRQLFKLKKAGIDSSIFSNIIISEEGDKKSDYLQTVQKLGFAVPEIYVCGDKISLDLIPAKELGYNTIHMLWGRGKNFEKKDLAFVDYSIFELSQIKEIIGKTW